MIDKLLAALAFLVFVGFVGILVVEVPSPDLIIVVAVAVCFVAYDMVTSLRNGQS
jgi:uncharacterized membrane protein YfcA